MPPRLILPTLSPQRHLNQFLTKPTNPRSVLPQLHSRSAHILSSISDNPGAYNKRIRRGRGPASGKGKTSGRGEGGQKQHGKVPAGFTGGQTPEYIVHGKRGFKNVLSADLAPINLPRIQSWIDQGRIDPTRPITIRELADSRCIHQTREGAKLLAHGIAESPSPSPSPSPSSPSGSSSSGTGILKQPVHIVVSRASEKAIKAVEDVGGSVTTRYYTPAAIKRIMKREMHPFISSAWTKDSGSGELLRAAGVDGPVSSSSTEGTVVTEGEGKKLSETQVMKAMGFKYRLPDPTARRDIEYYRDPAKRGYLSHLLRPMEGPSLFFRSPLERKSSVGVQKEKVLPENRLW